MYHPLSDTSLLARIRSTRVVLYTFSSVKYFISTGAAFGNHNFDRDDPSSTEEGEARPWCARRSCSLRNGNVREGYIKCPG
jgi:hypothetical protein